MTTTLQQIERVIQKAGIDGALTEDAIKFFNGVIETSKARKEELDKVKKELECLDERHSTLSTLLDEVRKELKTYTDREDDLEDREKEMLKLELTAQYEAERVSDHKEMFNVVFKNLGIRRAIFTSGQEPASGDYGGTISTSENKDETVVVE